MERSLVATLAAGFFSLFLTPLATQADERGSLDPIHEEAKLEVAEEHVTLTLPAADAHRVYVVEPIFPVFSRSKVWVVDGDAMKILGMFGAGAAGNLAISPDHSRLYYAETFWSRGDRGERTDVITAYDARTLFPVGEAVLEKGRFLVVPKRFNSDTSPDGRYVYSYNMAPSTAISVVDAQNVAYQGEIEIPGCALVFPSAPRRFSSICADGTLLTTTFDENLNAAATRSAAFFDAEKDPVFEHPAFDKMGNRLHFVTYEGNVISVDLTPDQPTFEKPWSLLSKADRKNHWRPGGWMLASYNAPLNRLYVLMHRGLQWTHKQAGEEVWVYDMRTKKRVQRIKLGDAHAHTLKVTKDEKPVLFTLTETAVLMSWDARTGKRRGALEGVGLTPYLLMTDGD
jgi:methylamine dehydrogenase heavy chain